MNISFGIITYQDDNLKELLSSIAKQKLKKTIISEIIVVSSKKEEPYLKKIIKSYSPLLKIKNHTQKKRKGKYSAVNLFLKKAKSEILILCSGDIILERNAIEKICSPLEDKLVGIVASKPMPSKLNPYRPLSYTIELLWKLHHSISLNNPKFGEFIAFRNLDFSLPQTAVDEEMIAKIIVVKGYKKHYAKNSIIYNKSPKTIYDYITQRRRIYCGHLNLQKSIIIKLGLSIIYMC